MHVFYGSKLGGTRRDAVDRVRVTAFLAPSLVPVGGWGGGGSAIDLFKIGARGRLIAIPRLCADFEKVDCGNHVFVALGPQDPWGGATPKVATIENTTASKMIILWYFSESVQKINFGTNGVHMRAPDVLTYAFCIEFRPGPNGTSPGV